MTAVREAFGPAGYGATWLLLERIAEEWDGKTSTELRLSAKEWRKTCGFSAKKLQDLLKLLEKREIIFTKNDEDQLCLEAPILVKLKDESTRKARKNSGIIPEPLRNDSGQHTEQEADIDKDKNKTHPPPSNTRYKLLPVLKQHGIAPDSERGRRLIRYTEQKQPENPGGYLQAILREKPYFDPPVGETLGRSTPGNGSGGPVAVANILRGMGYTEE